MYNLLTGILSLADMANMEWGMASIGRLNIKDCLKVSRGPQTQQRHLPRMPGRLGCLHAHLAAGHHDHSRNNASFRHPCCLYARVPEGCMAHEDKEQV